jgi:hypothetical protein
MIKVIFLIVLIILLKSLEYIISKIYIVFQSLLATVLLPFTLTIIYPAIYYLRINSRSINKYKKPVV